MSNRDEHDALGVVAGVGTCAGTAIVNDLTRTPAELVLMLATSALGGSLGSALPDVLEPATSPNHRSTMHSVTTATVVATKLGPAAARLAKQMIDGANPNDPLDRALRFSLAGLMLGGIGGYLSHLAADATTPKGIPLLTRGF